MPWGNINSQWPGWQFFYIAGAHVTGGGREAFILTASRWGRLGFSNIPKRCVCVCVLGGGVLNGNHCTINGNHCTMPGWKPHLLIPAISIHTTGFQSAAVTAVQVSQFSPVLPVYDNMWAREHWVPWHGGRLIGGANPDRVGVWRLSLLDSQWSNNHNITTATTGFGYNRLYNPSTHTLQYLAYTSLSR